MLRVAKDKKATNNLHAKTANAAISMVRVKAARVRAVKVKARAATTVLARMVVAKVRAKGKANSRAVSSAVMAVVDPAAKADKVADNANPIRCAPVLTLWVSAATATVVVVGARVAVKVARVGGRVVVALIRCVPATAASNKQAAISLS